MSRPLIWPQPLRSGDRVQLAATSSALEGEEVMERLAAGSAVLETWGLQVERRPLHDRQWGYLAGTDEQRRNDLALADPVGEQADPAPLLACLRGGWGAARLLERPLPLPARWLLGFSDVTSLLWAQLAQGQGGAVHGPLLTTLAAEPSWSQERLRRVLFGEALPPLQGVGWINGCASGPLLVANLTVATHLLGTPHLPDLRGAVLVLEDVGEAPYRIDRMLTHWRLSGALGQLAAIGFGDFNGCDDETGTDQPRDQPHRRLEQVLRERTGDLGIPVVAGLPVGHRSGNAALPLGVEARLDGRSGSLEVLG
jgi:muramoyltetrapeptide carboxypeptidase